MRRRTAALSRADPPAVEPTTPVPPGLIPTPVVHLTGCSKLRLALTVVLAGVAVVFSILAYTQSRALRNALMVPPSAGNATAATSTIDEAAMQDMTGAAMKAAVNVFRKKQALQTP